jgi:zinc and cadmium transporter
MSSPGFGDPREESRMMRTEERRWSWYVGLLIAAGITVLCGAGDLGSAPTVSTTRIQLTVYCGLVIAASMLGGLLPGMMRLTHTRLQLMMSLIGGLMLGVGMLHQLPHAVVILNQAGMAHALDWSMMWMLIGLVSMFFMLRMFHFHNHDAFDDDVPGHAHDHSHDHDHSADHDHHPKPQSTSWMGVTFGLSLHTITDGLALAAHVEADNRHIAGLLLPGLGTFLGIALHKPLDSLSITSLMSAAGWSKTARHAVNFAYALLVPLGIILFHLGLRSMSSQQNLFVGTALAFSAGVFVCIALSDLLPEVQFHSHDRVRLSLALVAGLVAAWAIGFLEPEHTHAPASHAEGEHGHGHDNDRDHDHSH